MDVPWSRLQRALAELGESDRAAPPTGRVGAVLALLSGPGDGLELLYTRRRDDLAHHPGQISFPGGRAEAGETVEAAALREAAEEVALDPATVEVLGQLPAFYIGPSRFWLHAVVARWVRPHPLRADPREVADILPTPVAHLRDERRWRVTRLGGRLELWAWELEDGHLLWGATAAVTVLLLEMLDPDWHGGTALADLGRDREVTPWRPGLNGARSRARLPGAPEMDVVAARTRAGGPATPASAGDLVAEAAAQLLASGGRALVLAGPGRTGAVGVHAAARLRERGYDVTVVRPAGAAVHDSASGPAGSLGDAVRAFDGALPDCDLVVDALVGRGLDGSLRGGVEEIVLALRGVAAPIVSVDVPSGIDPDEGFVGEAVSADVTLALGAPAAALVRPEIAAWIGDLYVVGGGAEQGAADPIHRIIAGGAS